MRQLGDESVLRPLHIEFDDNNAGNRLKMSTSTDGGLTWGPALNTANSARGIGGQPVVQPNGRVVVPTANANETSIPAFRSINGGVSWTRTVLVSRISDHRVAGNLRTGPLPSAEVDAAGRVYAVWQDGRFRTNCRSNDIVLSTSTDGVAWSAPCRIPIDAVTTRVDHFIPGLAVDRSTSGAAAHLALTFYFYPMTWVKSPMSPSEESTRMVIGTVRYVVVVPLTTSFW